jgi:2-dehydropantoate 2-reductase
MRFAIFGSGAVGGYYGAKLAQHGHDVTFIARGEHLQAIRERGLEVRSPLGDFIVESPAESDTARVGPVDVVIFAVKCYANDMAIPMLPPLVGDSTSVLTLQNGVDSAGEIASVIGEGPTLAGATYIATAIESPGLIVQTGTHRRIVFGEAFGARGEVSDRVAAIRDAMVGADILAEAVPDARGPLWEKFVYLAPFAGFTGAARLPIGPIREQPAMRRLVLAASKEVEDVARAEGVDLPDHLQDNLTSYIDAIPASTRSSLLIDLQQGKPIEVEALQGSVMRRGEAVGVATPIMSTLYALLKPYEWGPVEAAGYGQATEER